MLRTGLARGQSHELPGMQTQGLKPALILGHYAALKRRSSTVLHAFVGFPRPPKAVPLPNPRGSEFFRNLLGDYWQFYV